MQSKAKNVSEYINEIPEERKQAFNKLRQTILENIPKGFEECMIYEMIGYVVPHSIYPDGYHCNPKHLYHLHLLHHKKTSSHYITWEFT